MDSKDGYQGLVQRFGPKLVYQCWVPIPKASYPMFSPKVVSTGLDWVLRLGPKVWVPRLGLKARSYARV